jgi:hypothetical protein
MPAMSDSVFHEINEDLRRQQLEAFWRENAKWIIGGAIMAVILTAALTWWRGHMAETNTAATTAMMQALQSGDPAKLEAFADQNKDAHGALARLNAAAILAHKGDTAQAIAQYDAVAGTRGAPRIYRDLATLLSAQRQADNGDPEKIHKMLDALTGAKNPWRFSAYETKAALYARQGKTKDAVEMLTKISADPDAPQEMRARAFTFRELYMSEGKGG